MLLRLIGIENWEHLLEFCFNEQSKITTSPLEFKRLELMLVAMKQIKIDGRSLAMIRTTVCV